MLGLQRTQPLHSFPYTPDSDGGYCYPPSCSSGNWGFGESADPTGRPLQSGSAGGCGSGPFVGESWSGVDPLARQTSAATSTPVEPGLEMNGAGPSLQPQQFGHQHGRDSLYGLFQPETSFAHMAASGAYPSSAHPQHSQPDARARSRPASPIFQQSSGPAATTSARTKSSIDSLIVPYLQLPSSISQSKGSLAEFAAQITCLFWFESSKTLDFIEKSQQLALSDLELVHDANPTTGFLKWVTTILSTTQVTQNVILLALLFVYRLKRQNSTVKGKPGSEYRLLTVALMLGNKFLDDNTYTNKTWAEVSGISVHEIHVMEVEFLSHMKYNLYTSKSAWDDWHQQLGKFWLYLDLVSKKTPEISSRQPNARTTIKSHTTQTLPSPPMSTSATPPYGPSKSPNGPAPHHLLNVPSRLAQPAISPAAPLANLSEYRTGNGRKRSYDDSTQEPPFKRVMSSQAYFPSTQHGPCPPQSQGPTIPSLHSVTFSHFALPAIQSSFVQQYPALPAQTPLSNGHHMATGPPQPNWLEGVPGSSHLYHRDTPVGRQTPVNSTPNNAHPAPPTYASSAAHSTSQNQLSPSYFLTRRSSPYRPVRNISQLLVPPPSTSLRHRSVQVPNQQMHWQPLSKQSHEPRSGRLPYLHGDAWPETHQIDHWPSYPAHMQNTVN